MNGPERIRQAVAPVLEAFRSLGIRYCLTGSTASIHYGVPRSTMDVDLVAEIPPGKVRPLCEVLGGSFCVSEDAVREAVRRRASFNVIHTDTAFKIDVIVLRDEPYEREAFARRRREEVVPLGPSFVPAPEDALLSKILWYEKGGRVSDRQWTDVLGIVKAQGSRLDLEYLQRWARELGVEALLASALQSPEAP